MGMIDPNTISDKDAVSNQEPTMGASLKLGIPWATYCFIQQWRRDVEADFGTMVLDQQMVACDDPEQKDLVVQSEVDTPHRVLYSFKYLDKPKS